MEVVKMLAGLLVITLLVDGVSAVQRNAWTQGYLVGRAATGSDSGVVAPALAYGYPAYSSVHFGGFGLLLGFGLLALLFLGAGRLAFHRAWAMHRGPRGAEEGDWQRWVRAHAERSAHRWAHGPGRCWDWDGKPEGETPKAEAGETMASEAK